MECENGHKNHKDIYYGHILSNHNVDNIKEYIINELWNNKYNK